jgi:hypothetical protein
MVQTATARITKTGLCSTCNNVSTCFHFATRGPALFCELFDDHMNGAPPIARSRITRSPERRREAPVAPKTPVTLTGLCVNCEHRDACTFPKPLGGVWRCEEYA